MSLKLALVNASVEDKITFLERLFLCNTKHHQPCVLGVLHELRPLLNKHQVVALLLYHEYVFYLVLFWRFFV